MSQGWRQYLEAGMQAGEMTRAQAQRLVRELVKEGQIAEERTRAYVDEIVSRSRKRTEDLRKLVRREIQSQLSALGLATKADLAKLERRLERRLTTAAAPARRAPAQAAPKKSSAKPKRKPASKTAK